MKQAFPQSKAPLTYRLLVMLLSPAAAIFILKQAWKNKDWRYFWQRLGWRYPQLKTKPVWIHCASVGEVRAATPLIRELASTYSGTEIIVTSGTMTSAEVCQRTLSSDATHIYLPFDTPGAVKRFLDATQPQAAIVLETEIWPVLFATCHQRSIPLVIVNGRLSSKTLNAPKWLRTLYATTLAKVTAVLARSAEDASGFAQLGMNPDHIQTIGNIKFSALSTQPESLPSRLVEPAYWLAASTHDNEERQLAEILKHLPTNTPLLVIAPRHPNRLASIEKQLGALDVNYRVRSKNEQIEDTTQIYIADTLGELETLIAHAEFVFMGGSLVPVGGHNLLEPAALGKAIISGENLSNFKDEAKLLSEQQAIQIVHSQAELQDAVKSLLSDADIRKDLGEAAAKAVKGSGNILDDYVSALMGLITIK